VRGQAELERAVRIEAASKHMDNAASVLLGYIDSLTNCERDRARGRGGEARR
jgi:hypothetical protein